MRTAAGWLGFIHTGSGLQESETEVADPRRACIQKCHSCDQLLWVTAVTGQPDSGVGKPAAILPWLLGSLGMLGVIQGHRSAILYYQCQLQCPGKSQPHFTDEETEA